MSMPTSLYSTHLLSDAIQCILYCFLSLLFFCLDTNFRDIMFAFFDDVYAACPPPDVSAFWAYAVRPSGVSVKPKVFALCRYYADNTHQTFDA